MWSLGKEVSANLSHWDTDSNRHMTKALILPNFIINEKKRSVEWRSTSIAYQIIYCSSGDLQHKADREQADIFILRNRKHCVL